MVPTNTFKSALRVLLVDTFSESNYYGVELVRSVAPLVDLTVFTTRGTTLKPGEGFRLILGFPEFRRTRGKLEKLGTQIIGSWVLATQLWKHRKGVVHVQFFRSMLFEVPLYLLFRLLGGQLVFTAHNALPHESRWWHPLFYRFWYRWVTLVHVLSAHTAQQLASRFNLPPETIFVVPHGNYTSFYDEYRASADTGLRRDLQIPEDHIIALFFGMLRHYKGVDLLLKAFTHVDPNVRITLVIAGAAGAEMIRETEEAIRSLGLADHVRFLPGHLPDRDLAKYIENSDIIVLPYRNIYQSGALLLAMTFGKAILAADLAGFREYVHDGASAILEDPTDSKAFASALERLAGDTELRQALGDAARASALSDYDWNGIARRLVDKYLAVGRSIGN